MKHTIRHGLDHSLARKCAKRALETYRDNFSEFQPQGKWLSEDSAEISFSALGTTLKGKLNVYADRIDLDLQVPFMFRIFKSQAIAVIESEIRAWIERAKAGELDD